MALLVGIVLALGVSAFARLVGLDRDRAFYPTVLAVIAMIYDLFAVVGESTRALLAESVVTAIFLVAVALGFRRDLRIVVVALVAHGLFDFVHGHVIDNPGVPVWWPMFCLAYDITAAGCLAAWLFWAPEQGSGRLKSWREALEREMDAAALARHAGDPARAFAHLERAHILSQRHAWLHFRVHVAMWRWAWWRSDVRELTGQVPRMLAALVFSRLWVPTGNTGGARVGAFRRMPVPADLRGLVEESMP